MDTEAVAWLGLFVAVVALLVAVYFARRQSADTGALGARIDRVTSAVEGTRRDKADRAAGLAAAGAVQARAQRRANLRTRLRSEYILSHDGISPALMAGNADPPEEWCRAKLGEWGVDEREVYGPS